MRLRLLIILLFLKTISCFIFCNVILGQQQAVWPITNDSSDFADVATSPFGPRDKDDLPAVFEYDYHGGLDLQAAENTPVHAILGGIVKQSDYQVGLAGHYIRIYHKMWFSEYFHLKSRNVQENQTVTTGQLIGYSGETGSATGPHLHLGIFMGFDIQTDKDNKLNPVKPLQYTNIWAPDIITCYDHGSDFIDSMEAEVSTEHNELDLNVIQVFLYKEDIVRKIEMIFDEQMNVELGIKTYFGGTSFQTTVYTRPQDFSAGWPQRIKIVVVPYDNTGFPKEYDTSGEPKWMGILFLDLDGKADSRGNVSGKPLLPALNSFTALPLEKEIKVIWTLGRCSEAVGINLYRSKVENGGFVKINEQLINIADRDSQAIAEYSFVDRDVLPGMEYFYKLEKVLKDGKTEFFSEMVSAMIITDFTLNQNYPNPFNSSTIISYDIDSEEPVRTSLYIYNVLGRKVKTLVEEEKPVGHYQIEWDGKDEKGYSVSSGMYFYVLKTDKNIDKKKMLLLK